ncbi:MAG: fasciclin domain-containing protein [Gemmatimonadales bacterium]
MNRSWAIPLVGSLILLSACAGPPQASQAVAGGSPAGGQAAVAGAGADMSIARIASDSKDHTTLVAALKAVNWLDALANPGPLTVFAPVNAAFDLLPAGTVDNLLKPENAAQLRDILLHHVIPSVYQPADLQDGTTLSMLAGGSAQVSRSGDAIEVDGAKVIASVRAVNGMVYVVDAVMLPGGAR